MIATYIRNGGVFVFRCNGMDVACAVVNPKTNTLMVLNVLPEHRAHGLGSAILSYMQANFARVLESAVPFFERNGYRSVGALKRGNKLNTQVMIKASLIPLAGRMKDIFSGD
jgi:GNAT superfamily N-acetyltransferase